MIYLTMYWETALVDYDHVERWRNASPESREFWINLAEL
jgi:hypothetical protein